MASWKTSSPKENSEKGSACKLLSMRDSLLQFDWYLVSAFNAKYVEQGKYDQQISLEYSDRSINRGHQNVLLS